MITQIENYLEISRKGVENHSTYTVSFRKEAVLEKAHQEMGRKLKTITPLTEKYVVYSFIRRGWEQVKIEEDRKYFKVTLCAPEF